MPSLIRWGATLALAGLIWSSPMIQSLRVLALTQEQVVQKLNQVLVFTIADEEGALLLTPVPAKNTQNNPNTTNSNSEVAAYVAPLYFDLADARTLLEGIQRSTSEAAKRLQQSNLQVVPLPLGEAFTLEETSRTQSQQNNSAPLVFELIPQAKEREAALEILRREGYQGKEFNGVPLFYAKKESGQEATILPFFFFSRAQLTSALEQAQKPSPDQPPALATALKGADVGVIDLATLIQFLRTTDSPAANNPTGQNSSGQPSGESSLGEQAESFKANVSFIPTPENQQLIKQLRESLRSPSQTAPSGQTP